MPQLRHMILTDVNESKGDDMIKWVCKKIIDQSATYVSFTNKHVLSTLVFHRSQPLRLLNYNRF